MKSFVSFLRLNAGKLLVLLLLLTVVVAPAVVSAQDTSVSNDIGNQLQAAGGSKGAGFGVPTDPRITILLFIRYGLEFIGTLMFCYMLYAGFLWMTAGGNDEQISQAKKIIRNCVIGLLIIMSAYSITYFIITVALDATAGPSIHLSATLFF